MNFQPPEPWIRTLAELIRKTSTELPADIVATLAAGQATETPGCRAATTLGTILDNATLAAETCVPMCQDTGTLTFWFEAPRRTDHRLLEEAARQAVRDATANGWLRLNVIDVPSGAQVSDNVAEGNPSIHIEQRDVDAISVRLLMKGGGCENMNIQYSLPDASLGAGRDLEGVRRCLLDAVWRAQGNGCAPGILGVCVGGDRANGYAKAKAQLLRTLDDAAPDPALAELERRVLREANTLGIGPMGLGGATTLLGVKVATLPRLPASYFVSVAYGCWACRRGIAALKVEI
ncbi:MAG: fumarate hydratase [Kiritimatiellae bacterium]|jgi:fumarate hydratase class I|nr:fumarate hydratase [Kiritimatiellia bacterium]